MQNERLKDEQVHYINLLLKQARELEGKMSEEKDVDKKDVIEVMMDKWEAGREEEKNIAGWDFLSNYDSGGDITVHYYIRPSVCFGLLIYMVISHLLLLVLVLWHCFYIVHTTHTFFKHTF